MPQLALLLGGADVAGSDPAQPLRFDSEVVRLFIEEDSLRVEGVYRFLCLPSRLPAVSLIYPYPADSLLGGARSILLECRAPDGAWHPLQFRELPWLNSVGWRVPLDLSDTIEIRTVYRQALLSTYARYIVTTTRTWKRPLRHARFEIHLPRGARPLMFSHAFRHHEADGESFHVYEAEGFMPDKDIVVEWSPSLREAAIHHPR